MEEERSLSQQYSLTGKLVVAPRTKLKVKITTYAVTYKSTLKVQFSVQCYQSICFAYIPRWALYFCGGSGCLRFGSITAEDLFENEMDFNLSDGIITFIQDTELSYLGEVLEMNKQEVALQ